MWELSQILVFRYSCTNATSFFWESHSRQAIWAPGHGEGGCCLVRGRTLSCDGDRWEPENGALYLSCTSLQVTCSALCTGMGGCSPFSASGVPWAFYPRGAGAVFPQSLLVTLILYPHTVYKALSWMLSYVSSQPPWDLVGQDWYTHFKNKEWGQHRENTHWFLKHSGNSFILSEGKTGRLGKKAVEQRWHWAPLPTSGCGDSDYWIAEYFQFLHLSGVMCGLQFYALYRAGLGRDICVPPQMSFL